MYLEQLRSFCAVVEHGSYTRAARQLHLSQPAVSQHVRSLGQSFNLVLLERVGGRMQPSVAGELVYGYAREILNQADAMRSAIAALKGLRGGHLVVGAGRSVGNYVLPPMVARFRHRFPDVRVEMRVDNASRVFDQVLRGAVDFGIALGYQVPRGIVTEPLYVEPIVLVVAPDHPITRSWPRAIPRAAIAALPFIALSAQISIARRFYEAWLRAAGIEPRIDMEFDSSEPIKQVVAAGMGAAFLFGSDVAQEVEAGKLHLLDVAGPPLHGQFVLARRARAFLSPAARAFIEAVAHELAQARPVEQVNLQAAARFCQR